jgi:hypothetical protein
MGRMFFLGFQNGTAISARFLVWDVFLGSFQDGTDILVRSRRGRYSCEFPLMGQIFLRGVQDGTCRRGFHIGTDIIARFPE